jgi:hypothetical protein
MALSRFHCGPGLGLLAFTAFFVQGLHAELQAEPRPYQLNYDVFRNGKLAGQAEITMQQQGGQWIIRSEGSGTHGLGRLLGVSDAEQAEGNFLDGRFRPDRFSHRSRLAGFSDNWSAQFNWQDDTVTITKGKDVLSLELGQGALDRLSLNVDLQWRLRERDPDLQLFEVSDDKIKPRTYRLLPPEQLETSLGCINTLPVELIPSGNTNFSRSWHAPDLDFLAVRLDRGKTNGTHLEMRITSMVLDGKKIESLGSCSAVHSNYDGPAGAAGRLPPMRRMRAPS